MTYANTLTLTINAVAKTLTRTGNGKAESEYTFKDSVEKIIMKVRHDTVLVNKLPTNRHNVQIDHTVYGTPSTAEKYYSVGVTLRDREGSGPTPLLQLWQGSSTLLLTLDDTLVIGDN